MWWLKSFYFGTGFSLEELGVGSLSESKGGCIINICSFAGLLGAWIGIRTETKVLRIR